LPSCTRPDEYNDKTKLEKSILGNGILEPEGASLIVKPFPLAIFFLLD
jgi:hypothetical protein